MNIVAVLIIARCKCEYATNIWGRDGPVLSDFSLSEQRKCFNHPKITPPGFVGGNLALCKTILLIISAIGIMILNTSIPFRKVILRRDYFGYTMLPLIE